MEIKIEGMAKLQARLNRAGAALKNRKRLNHNAVTLVDKWIQQNFQSEGGKVGGWEPLSPLTIKARRGSRARILQDRGWLKSRWDLIADARQAKIVSKTSYGYFHDKGKGVPKRQIIPTVRQIQPELQKLYNHFIGKALK